MYVWMDGYITLETTPIARYIAVSISCPSRPRLNNPTRDARENRPEVTGRPVHPSQDSEDLIRHCVKAGKKAGEMYEGGPHRGARAHQAAVEVCRGSRRVRGRFYNSSRILNVILGGSACQSNNV